MLRTLVVIVGWIVTQWTPAAQAAPCAGFTDVDSTAPFCTEVAWIKNRGITLGCTTTLYCPDSAVTRLQMALFMYRQGTVTVQLGGNTTNGTARFGTLDNQPVELIANNSRVLRLEPHHLSPNVFAGYPENGATIADIHAATIGGGGYGGVTYGGISCAPTGCRNAVSDVAGTIGGGVGNVAGNNDADVSTAAFATVGGGFANQATGFGSVVAGGRLNIAASISASVAGGVSNQATGPGSAVGGGESNLADGGNATVAGGFTNRAGGTASFVAGGSRNRALGIGSVAAGIFAQADHNGCFVFADRSNSANPTSCFATNEIVVRGLGGFYFWTAGTSDATYSGARLAPGTGAWAAYSDSNGKHAVAPVDTALVLEKLVSVPIATWQWKAEAGRTLHMGPTAQDFRAAFGLGARDTEIVTVDADGVALAAIQGLNAKLEAERVAKDAQIAVLRAELAELRSLKADVARLEAAQRGAPALR